MIYYLLKNIKLITISKTWILINAFLFLACIAIVKGCFNLLFKRPFNAGIKKIATSVLHVWKIK
jgi:hypothetical protein